MVYTIDFPDPGVAVTWTLTSDGVVRDRHPYHPTIFVATDTAGLLADVSGVFDGHPRVQGLERVERRPGWRHDSESVLRVTAQSLSAVDELAKTASQLGRPGEVRLYNVDFSQQFRYCLETGTDPTPNRDPSVLRLSVSPTSYEQGLSKATLDDETISGSAHDVATTVESRIADADPDVLQLSSSKLVPHLFDATDTPIDEYALGREPGYSQLASQSTYESYGRVGHSPARYKVPGRAIIDESNTFWLTESNLDGIIDLVSRSWKPLQETAWASIGNILTAIQIRYADQRDVLVPWRSWRHERFKTARTLDAADRGGYTFAPDVGIHEAVHELDFSSLYPNIICEHNISPETVRCDCHPERSDVPDLEYAICPEDGYLPEVLGPIIDDRDQIKQQIQETDDPEKADALRGASSALKWILVSCFGYQGFANAKFGRIECHEAINAFAREILLDAKTTFQKHGWRIVHGIVDSVWVQAIADRDQTPIREVAADITEETGIRLEYEAGYDWIAFCPRRNDDAGALTRYFGQQTTPDGEDPEFKFRGIEIRQRSTPTYFEDVQETLIREFGEHRDPEHLCATLQGRIQELRRGAVNPADLAITNRVSKPLDEYSQSTRNVAALQRAEDVGIETHPGENVEYVVVDDDKRGRDRVTLLSENPQDYDAEYYVEELIRVGESVIAPMGWREVDIRRYLADHVDTTLTAYTSLK